MGVGNLGDGVVGVLVWGGDEVLLPLLLLLLLLLSLAAREIMA